MSMDFWVKYNFLKDPTDNFDLEVGNDSELCFAVYAGGTGLGFRYPG